VISREGRRYRTEVCAALAAIRGQALSGRLSLRMVVCPPDRRRRDLDNTQKALLDALAHAGVYHDDSQIDRLISERGPVVPGGRVLVEISTLDAASPIPT
jgi:crossover junction endodeoxyribonuclease RusA